MKKTIFSPLTLSVAIASVFATGVQAKTVYEDDAMYLNLTGEVAFELIRDVDDGDKTEPKTDNVDLEVKAGYKLENGVEVAGYYAFEFAGWSAEQSSAKDLLKDHYIIVKKDSLTVQYGDFDYSVDRFGIAKDLDAKTTNDSIGNPDDSDADGSKSVLEVQYKGDGFYVASSFDPGFDKDDASDETSYDIFAKFNVSDDVTIGAVYSFQEYYDGGTGNDAYDQTSYGAQIQYTGIQDLYLGASYVYGDRDDDNKDASGIDLAAQYKISKKIKVAAGVGLVNYDEDANDDVTWTYVNANYNFTKNVDAYAEVYDEDKDQLGFVVGMSVDF
ncbi:porin [Vibrio sp. RC27]